MYTKKRIPLTGEILLKNGFKTWGNQVYHKDIDIMHAIRYPVEGWRVEVNLGVRQRVRIACINRNSGIDVKCRCHFVDEFLLALQVAGLEKLLKEFQV